MEIVTKRLYEPRSDEDGYRVLVDRLWPRGIRKEDAPIDLWLKEVAPSTALRQWYHQQPEAWDEFRARYFAELAERSEHLHPLLDALERGTVITLLYASRRTEQNHAVALKEYLISRLQNNTNR